jgi:hypothetical protein
MGPGELACQANNTHRWARFDKGPVRCKVSFKPTSSEWFSYWGAPMGLGRLVFEATDTHRCAHFNIGHIRFKVLLEPTRPERVSYRGVRRGPGEFACQATDGLTSILDMLGAKPR